MPRTGGLDKKGKIRRVKEGKERGKGREVHKVSGSLPSQGTLASCVFGGDQGLKGPGCGPWVYFIGRQTGPWVPTSDQDVSHSEESHQSRHLLQEELPLPEPKSGLLSNTWK